MDERQERRLWDIGNEGRGDSKRDMRDRKRRMKQETRSVKQETRDVGQ